MTAQKRAAPPAMQMWRCPGRAAAGRPVTQATAPKTARTSRGRRTEPRGHPGASITLDSAPCILEQQPMDLTTRVTAPGSRSRVMWAALSKGFTAVPVIQGNDAVVTTVTLLCGSSRRGTASSSSSAAGSAAGSGGRGRAQAPMRQPARTREERHGSAPRTGAARLSASRVSRSVSILSGVRRGSIVVNQTFC